jgi:hypothetical protein
VTPQQVLEPAPHEQSVLLRAKPLPVCDLAELLRRRHYRLSSSSEMVQLLRLLQCYAARQWYWPRRRPHPLRA